MILWVHSGDANKSLRVVAGSYGFYSIEVRRSNYPDRGRTFRWEGERIGGKFYMTIKGLAFGVQCASSRLYGAQRGKQCVEELVGALTEQSRPQTMMARSKRKWRPVKAPAKPINDAAYHRYAPSA